MLLNVVGVIINFIFITMSDQVESHIMVRYNLTSKVGKGAYGVVWKAVEKASTKTVALKKVFDAFNNVTDAQRTYREVAFLRQLKHPNIVNLFTTYPAQNEKDLYMVFEYMETDLHVAIRANVLEELHRRYIVYQILKALKYMHTAGVIHRDLKPANILLDSQCTAKLADFGLARSVSDYSENDSVLTEYVATRWFRSPEILIGSRNYSRGVDMWSLGCIMGEMLLGKALFPGQSTLNQLQKITEAIGSPTKHDILALQTNYALELFNNLPTVPKPKLRTFFKDAEDDEIDLIEKLLVYDPQRRLNVEEALAHPYVAQFRNRDEEISFRGQIALELDDNTHFDIQRYRDFLYGVGRKSTPKPTPKLQKKEVAKINELVQKQKQSMVKKTFENYMSSPKNSAVFKRDPLEVSPHKKKNSHHPQTNSVKNLHQAQKVMSPGQKIQTSPGASPTHSKQPFNYVDYVKQYQQTRKQSNPIRQSKCNVTTKQRPPSVKKDDSTVSREREKSRQNSPTTAMLGAKKTSITKPQQRVNTSSNKPPSRVKSPETRPWTSTVYQRSTFKNQGIQSFYQKAPTPTLYRSALNQTAGNRILSNLTNNSVLCDSANGKPSKSQQYLSKLLKRL